MRVLVTGSAGFIGSHIVEALRERGHDVRTFDLVSGEDVRDPGAVARSLSGVDAVCHQAAKVGLGVDVPDLPDYADVNDPGTAVLLAGDGAGPASAGSCWPPRWSSTARAPTTAPSTARSRPGPRAVGRPRRRPVRAAVPGVRAAAGVRHWSPRTRRSTRATSTRRPRSPRSTWPPSWARLDRRPAVALRYHNVYGPRMPRDTPYAGVAAIFRSAPGARRGAAGVRGRRPAPRLRARPRRRRGQPARAGRDRRRTAATCAPTTSAAVTPHTVGEMAAALAAASAGPTRGHRASTGSATSGTSWPRPSAPRRRARLPGADRLRRGHGRVRQR